MALTIKLIAQHKDPSTPLRTSLSVAQDFACRLPLGVASLTFIHRSRDERLPKGPRFASESLDAHTASGSFFKLTHYRKPAQLDSDRALA